VTAERRASGRSRVVSHDLVRHGAERRSCEAQS
jgi:hypothetical protein